MFGTAEDTGPGFSVRNEKREGWSGVEGAECDRWGPASYRGFGDFKTRAVSENLSSGLVFRYVWRVPLYDPRRNIVLYVAE